MAAFILVHALAGANLPAGAAQRLEAIAARAGQASTLQSAVMAVSWVDLGLWPSSGVRVEPGSVAAVAGDPVWCVDGLSIGRASSVDRVAAALLTANFAALKSCEGSFSALAADLSGGTAVVAVDKLAVRPVYWAVHDGVVYAASALWMLERLADLPKECDWRGITEIAAFGYPLSNRTSYLGIEALAPGSALVCSEGRVRTVNYWDWRQPPASDSASDMGFDRTTAADPVERIESAFHRAVDDRLGDAEEGLAFLSGGMDSRYIASRLRQRGVQLNTLNFAPEGSADLAFGRLAATAMGARHFEFGAGDAPFTERKSDAIAAWRQQRASEGAAPAQDLRVLWSGDGGSVVLGHVYLDDQIVNTARSQGLDAAAGLIQRHNKYQVSPRMFTGKYRQLAAVPLQGIRDELQRCAALEPGRACHLFFVLNDQRRHLVEHFEHVHELGFDQHLPFFDGRLMQAVFNCPVELLVGHRLYNRLFERLPFGLGQVPWQAYPGHEPCPVKHDEALRRQWSDGWFDAATERQKRADKAGAMRSQLRSPAFPAQVLSRLDLAVALQLTRWGVRDYSYLATGAQPFVHASRVSGRWFETR